MYKISDSRVPRFVQRVKPGVAALVWHKPIVLIEHFENEKEKIYQKNRTCVSSKTNLN